MDFEYDPNKSASNKIKHGIDFEEAKELWNGCYISFDILRDCGEPRFGVIGMLYDKHWTAIATMRGDKIRIISVRRSHKDEEVFFNEQIN